MVSEQGFGLEPNLAAKLQQALQNYEQQQSLASQPAILLVSASLRQSLARLVRHTVPQLHVLSYQEIPDEKQIKIVGTIGK